MLSHCEIYKLSNCFASFHLLHKCHSRNASWGGATWSRQDRWPMNNMASVSIHPSCLCWVLCPAMRGDTTTWCPHGRSSSSPGSECSSPRRIGLRCPPTGRVQISLFLFFSYIYSLWVFVQLFHASLCYLVGPGRTRRPQNLGCKSLGLLQEQK